jgi:N-6 DNA Methylase
MIILDKTNKRRMFMRLNRQARRKAARQAKSKHKPNQDLWNRIATEVDRYKFMGGIDRDKDRIKRNGETFTPTALVIDMLRNMDIAGFAPGKTVLDPAAGDGQFLVAVKYLKMFHFGMSEQEALDDIYGVELMPDNVARCIKRLGPVPPFHILVGDTLNPTREVPGQSEEDRFAMAMRFAKPDKVIEKDGHSVRIYGENTDSPLVILG